MNKLVEVKTDAGVRCETVLRTIYPRRVLFTRSQIADAATFIKRLGYEQTLKIADWAARKASIKDGRYEAWVRTCRKTIGSTQKDQA